MSEFDNQFRQVRLPALLCMALAIGIFLGAHLSGSNTSEEVQKARSKFGDILGLIQTDYVDTVDVEKLFELGITGMLSELDPHTSYIPARDKMLATSQLEGNFEGVGVEFNVVRDTLYVVSTISGGPAERAGLQPGDKIILVDNKPISHPGLSTTEVFERLRGPKGSVVQLTIRRHGVDHMLSISVERAKVPSHSVTYTAMLDEETGYIKIARFAATTGDEFHDALEFLRGKGMTRLILDLRENRGGYMRMAVQVCEELLEKGKLIVYTDGKGTKYDESYSAERDGLFEFGEVVVLVDEGSASAAEIVAGALQDNDRALVIGRRTFGKGLVQSPIELRDGSELRLTISRYYTPSGRSIQKPYGPGANYAHDILERFETGELFEADSVPTADSLKYRTVGGRTVYGGGGIIPDVFVAKDTTGYSLYLERLYRENVLREYGQRYAASHREAINAMGLGDFVEDFHLSNQMFSELVEMGRSVGIKPNYTQLRISRVAIEHEVKAVIARSLWKEAGYYRMRLSTDPYIKAAYKHFPVAERLLESRLR